MPKTFLREIDRFESVMRDNFKLLRAFDKVEDNASIMGVSKGTVTNRTSHPLDLTLAEIYLICRSKGITVTDFVSGRLELRGRETKKECL